MYVYLIVHPVPNNLNQIIKKPAYVIAVDQGLFDAYKQGIHVDLAIGDFDSLKDKSLLENIQSIHLDPVKDLTDTESALLHAQTLKPEHIYIVGGLGGARFEHSYANLLLVQANNRVSIISDNTEIVKYTQGIYQTTFKGYINVFASTDAVISLKGFKFGLNSYKLNKLDRLGISNELILENGTIEVIKGEVIVMYSKNEQ